ncbi:MAG: hypothetical protein JSR72_01005 [Proteobacteria bacterium]|nr:hypothetical protein [Pseudomonadota bacterium]
MAIVFLAASPRHGIAADDQTTDEIGRGLGAFNEMVQGAGQAGQSLKNVANGDFKALGLKAGSQSSTAWNSLFASWRDTSQSVRKSLPYSVVPGVLTTADAATSVLMPAVEGDGRGAVSGAVNIGAAAAVSAVGATAGGYVFSSIGGVIGGYMPMVSTAAGVTIGGAIGPVVGTIALAYAFDKYGKEYVANAVEGLIALGDPDPVTQAIRAREDFFARQAGPELAAEWKRSQEVSAGFGQEEQQLPGKLSGWYQPKLATPGQPAGPTLASLASARKFELVTWIPGYPTKVTVVCSGADGKFNCKGGYKESQITFESTLTLALSGDKTEFREHGRLTSSSGTCTLIYEFDGGGSHTLAPGGTLIWNNAGFKTYDAGGNCKTSAAGTFPPQHGVGSWRIIE